MMIDEELAREIAEMRAEREIRRMIQRYMRGTDRKDYEMIASIFHDDAIENHGPMQGDPRDMIEWVRKQHENVEQAMRFMGDSIIEFDGDDRAFVETYCIAIQHRQTGAQSAGTGKRDVIRMITGIRYIHRFEKRDGAWKIAHRIVVPEWLDEGLGTIDFGPEYPKAHRSREDSIYKIREL